MRFSFPIFGDLQVSQLNVTSFSKAELLALLESIPLIGCNVDRRELDTKLFRLVDARPVKKLTVVFSEDIVGDDPGELSTQYVALKQLASNSYDDWFSETRQLHADCCPDDHVCETCENEPAGGDAAVLFDLAWPIHQRIPEYTRSAESALAFKSRLTARCVQIEERDGAVESVFRATMLGHNGEAVTYSSPDLACAIVGATLLLLARDESFGATRWGNQNV